MDVLRIFTLLGSGLVALVFAAATVVQSADSSIREAFRRPDSIPFPADAPYDLEIATLGKMLFFDTRLSGAQNMNCVSCHNPSFGWEAPVALSIGSMNQPLSRHAPTLFNLAWSDSFFWDGRASSLEEQAIGPITAPQEMNSTFELIIARLSEVPEYRTHFERVFPGEGISQATILRAIATYERTIVSGIASFDRWVEGEEDAISEAAKRGFELFIGRADCVRCHTGWNFSDGQLHDVGLSIHSNDTASAFKTPSLRSIALRAPFMHDGSLDDLDAVIRHYATGGASGKARVPDVVPFDVSERDVADLIAFMETLSEYDGDVPTPILPAN